LIAILFLNMAMKSMNEQVSKKIEEFMFGMNIEKYLKIVYSYQ